MRLISTATGRAAHLGEQAVHVALEGERGAVADAARAGDLDGLADVEGEVLGRHQAEPELARMQRDRHVLGEEADHPHVRACSPARAI